MFLNKSMLNIMLALSAPASALQCKSANGTVAVTPGLANENPLANRVTIGEPGTEYTTGCIPMPYTVYPIFLDGDVEKPVVEARYNEFLALKNNLPNSLLPKRADAPFPGKRWLFNRNQTFVEDRRVALEQWLKKVVELDPLFGNEDLKNFLRIQTTLEERFQLLQERTDANDAEKHLEQAAEQGSADAQFWVGCKAAFPATMSMCEFMQDPEEQSKSGDRYHYGFDGFEQDHFKALGLYEKAAAQGNANAECQLGHMYQFGNNAVSKDLMEAQKWYEKAVAQGHEKAQTVYNSFVYNSPVYNLGRVYNSLGRMYEFGDDGYPKDLVEAQRWYKKAIEQGQVGAHYKLGYVYEKEGDMYRLGTAEVDKNPSKAKELYEMALEEFQNVFEQEGGVRVYGRVGRMYYYLGCLSQEGGEDGEESYKKAVEQFKLAVQHGSSYAQYKLGFMYEYGKGVQRDLVQAREWYKQAAEHGHKLAQEQLNSITGV